MNKILKAQFAIYKIMAQYDVPLDNLSYDYRMRTFNIDTSKLDMEKSKKKMLEGQVSDLVKEFREDK